MPIISEGEAQFRGQTINVEPTEEQGPGFFDELVPAAFRLENTIGSALSDVRERPGLLDPEFNPLDFVPEQHAQFSDRYAYANSEAEAGLITRQLDREIEDRQRLAAGGFAGFAAAFAAGIADPVNLIPIGGATYTTYRTGRSVLKGALATGTAGFLGTTAAEYSLQATQETRTFGESALNIAGGTFLSGILGAGAGAISRSAQLRAGKSMDDLVAGVERDLTVDAPGIKLTELTPEQAVDEFDLPLQETRGRASQGVRFFKATTPDGKQIDISVRVDGDVLRIEDIVGGGSGSAGLSSVRSIQQQLLDAFPEVNRVTGERTGGARFGGKRVLEGEGIEAGVDVRRSDVPVGPTSAGAAASRGLPPELIADIEAKVRADVDAGKVAPEAEQVEIASRIQAEELRFEGIEDNVAVRATLKVLGKQDPVLRTLQSDVAETRNLTQEIAEIPLNLRKNTFGDATPRSVQRLVANWQAPLYRALREMDDNYVRYVRGRPKRFGDIAAIGVENLVRRNRKLTPAEFRTEVGKAMRRGDVHEIPEVAKAAKTFRRELFDPLKERAIAAKLLPEDVKVETAVSYLMRIYDIEKLASPVFRNRFIETTVEWMARRNLGEDATPAQIARALDDPELRDVAEQIVGRIEGTPDGRLPYDVTVPNARKGPKSSGLAKPLRGRVFNIPDELIEEFLESDIEVIAKRFTRSMGPDVELATKFGDVDITSRIDDIRRAYERQATKAGVEIGAETTAARRWRARRDADIRDISAMRDRIRNIYGMPNDVKAISPRIGRAIRQLNFVRLLGGMTLSAIPDIGRPVMVHGFGRVFGDALIPLVRNVSGVRKVSREIRDLGGATDMLMNSRMQALASLEDEFSRFTKVERGLGAVSDTFGMVSLMAPWNTTFKQLAGIVSQARFIRSVRADVAGEISQKELKLLRAAGISADDARLIAKQLDEFGGEEDGVLLSGAMDWTDARAFEAFQSALVRDIERIIVTPGLDQPLTATGGLGEAGKMLFQFKSFAFASTQRMLISGLQQRDMAALNGTLLSIALGMLSYNIKTWDAGREVSDDPTQWLIEGIDRSGVLAIPFEANNILEKITRNQIGLGVLTGGPPLSRYASRNAIGALLGPSFETAGTALGLAGNLPAAAFGDDEVKASDIHAMRKLLPYQNLFLFRQLLDRAEQGVASGVGAVQ